MVKIFNLQDAPKEISSDGKKTVIWITDVINAKDVGVIMLKAQPNKEITPYHYHSKRWSIHIVLNGTAIALLEGKRHQVGPNTVIYTPSGERHKLIVGNEEFKAIEIFSPLEPDLVEVPEEM